MSKPVSSTPKRYTTTAAAPLADNWNQSFCWQGCRRSSPLGEIDLRRSWYVGHGPGFQDFTTKQDIVDDVVLPNNPCKWWHVRRSVADAQSNRMPVPLLGSPRSCTLMSCTSFPSLPVPSSLVKRSSHAGHGSSANASWTTSRPPAGSKSPSMAKKDINSATIIVRRRCRTEAIVPL